MPIRTLTELSALANAAIAPDEAVQRALAILQRGLAATDVFFVYGDAGGFRRFGTHADLELTDIALSIVHRDLTSRGGPCAFDLRDGRVADFRNASARRAGDYCASLIPMPSSAGDMLVARGPWAGGLGTSLMSTLQAALPAVALVLERRLDSSRAERQRNQLSAFANITRVMSESEDLETVLTSIAAGVAVVTGVDYVSIDIVDATGAVTLRTVNALRTGIQQLRGRWKRGATKPDPVRDAVISTRRPMLFPDSQNDDRIPEAGRNYFVRTLIRSTASFPLVAKDEVLGVLSVASHRPLRFPPQEVELLEGLATQVATLVKGVQLYQELATSREELQRLNEQLQESMSIQHHLARTDPLTGIPNRRFIDETIEAECARACRYGQPLSVVVADLDDLKEINDTYGHAVGDDMLRFVAGLARQSCRQVDVVGRYGGDEFVFVLPATDLQDAAAFAERFRRRLATEPAPGRDGDALHPTVSLGVAQWDNQSMEEPASLIRRGDDAMYEAKTGGGDRVAAAARDSARVA